MAAGYVSTRMVKELEPGSRVKVRGWVYRHRDLGRKVFIVLRDADGILQLVADEAYTPQKYVEEARNASIESSIIAEGVTARDPRAPGGVELRLERLEIVGPSVDFPIKGGEGIDYLLENRHLWIRSRKLTAMWRIRQTAFKAFREFFESRGFWEVSPPMLTQAAVEGGATLFKVDFFGKPAYLTQSSQFYLEALIFSLERVWTLAPSFRAERSRTRRHLYEYWHLEAEEAWVGMEGEMKLVEELVAYTTKRILEERLEELSLLKRKTEPLEPALKTPYPRIRYEEAIRRLQGKGVKIEYGDDLGADEERLLTEDFDTPFFITHFPMELKSFYMKPDPHNPREALAFDLLAPEGVGEIVGGSERQDDYQALYKQIESRGYNPEDYQWYLDLRKYGSVPHSGFGLGVERYLMWVTGVNHVRDTVPFPRFRDRIYP
ncbi:MAG: asparagine--tRNA ligase [Desulfurococcales archaeon]|nr:asparagine--tRNA ligase [Desulfurococcales archaeon]MCE4627515.1 asparagine--tRNA ligase [Desulfurococcales archaeon]